MSEEEKNAIREQHSGGMKLNTEKFFRLLESKLGDAKPLINEQQTPFIEGKKYTAKRSVDGKTYTLLITKVQPSYVLAKITGDGTYENQPMDGKYEKELTIKDGKLVGNMAMGEFTDIVEKK